MAISPPPSDRVRVAPFGESAALVDLGVDAVPDRAARTHAAAEALRARLPGADVVVGAGAVLVMQASIAEVEAIARAGALEAMGHTVAGRSHRFPVVYDGPDLAPLAGAIGVSAEEIIARHAAQEVVAELIGFLPGFAYLGPIDPRLQVPRRPSPRPMVAAGSVGVAGAFTGIYPFVSPGGWNLLGRAIGISLFDPARDPPTLIQPGDRVRFAPVAAGDVPPSPAPIAAPVEALPVRGIRVISAQAGATVQDAGRPGQQHRGLPPSGALDVEALARANEAVGNAAGAAAIEIPLGAIEIEAVGTVTISVDGAPADRLSAGERRAVPACRRAVRYVAVRGGIAVPEVLFARATLLVARLGGFHGRPLRKGDVLPVGEAEDRGAARVRPMPDAIGEEALAVDPGPHLDRFPAGAIDVLCGTAWQVSRLGDRVGVRLEGGRIPRDRPDLALPLPMRRGAVQVSTDGTPIVLGPDHPATGGYPVLAILRAESQSALARRRPGDQVRFRIT